MGEKIFLGALDVEQGETVTLTIPLDASPEKIAAAIEAANCEKIANAKAESEALAKLFHLPDQTTKVDQS